MKTMLVSLILTLSLPTLAATRPGGGRPETAKPKTNSAALVAEKVNELNTYMRDGMGLKSQIEAPKEMSETEQASFVAKLGELQDALKNNSTKFTSSEAKLKVDSLLESYNSALTSRSSFKSSFDSLTDASAKEAAREIIELIDNGPKIIEAKVSETGEALVSEGLILMTFSKIAESVDKTNLSAKEILDIKKELERPFENERWTLQDIARCR